MRLAATGTMPPDAGSVRMPGLQIQPHSRRLSNLAVVGLALLAAGAFGIGVSRQVHPPGALFPAAETTPAQAGSAAAAIPEATPAPDMQLAAVAPAPRHHLAKDAALDPAAGEAPGAETPPAVDTAAIVGDAPPSPGPAPTADPADPLT